MRVVNGLCQAVSNPPLDGIFLKWKGGELASRNARQILAEVRRLR